MSVFLKFRCDVFRCEKSKQHEYRDIPLESVDWCLSYFSEKMLCCYLCRHCVCSILSLLSCWDSSSRTFSACLSSLLPALYFLSSSMLHIQSHFFPSIFQLTDSSVTRCIFQVSTLVVVVFISRISILFFPKSAMLLFMVFYRYF